MKLYIANTTKQNHKFTFRLPEMKHNKIVEIKAGSQMMVHNGNSDELEAIIAHHHIYGLTEAKKLDQRQEYVGLCYSIDKPVTYGNIENAIRDNDEKLIKGAHERRQAAAAGLDQKLQEQGIGYSGSMEMSSEQAKTRDEKEDAPTVNERIATEKRAGGKK